MSYPPPLLELPLHLVSVVMEQLDSMQSLGSAILSHSLFYIPFRDNRRHIVRCVLRNQFPPGLIPYAEAAFKAKFVNNDVRRDVRILLESSFNRVDINHNGLISQEWDLEWLFDHNVGGYEILNVMNRRQDIPSFEPMDAFSIASAISKTHCLVEYFCGCFVRERLPLMRELMGEPLDSEGICPSKVELFRIRRALYRFQIYCNLVFRRQIDFHPGRWIRQPRNSFLQEYFFQPFPLWVNEQLCCIHDYLEEVLSRSFDDVAAHDVDWGALSVDWLTQGRLNEHKQAFLTYGLPFLFQLKTARGYEHRLQLLKSKGLPRTAVALAAHLERAVPIHINRRTWHTTLVDTISWAPRSPYEEDLIEIWPGAHEDVDAVDSAPFLIWLAAHRELPLRGISYLPENMYLRKCGYVMWDIAVTRRDDLGVDDETREWIQDGKRRALIETIERQRGRDQMRRSWEERAAIRERGGRGYWESG